MRPPFPAILPIARDRWSPFNLFTVKTVKNFLLIFCPRSMQCIPSWTSKLSRNNSSSRRSANASSTSKPRANALTKSAAFWRELISFVSLLVYETMIRFRWSLLDWYYYTLISTILLLVLNRTCRNRWSTMGVNIFIQFSFNGLYLCEGMATFRTSSLPF